MRTKTISYFLLQAAVVMSFSCNEAKASFSAEIGSPNVNFRISDYQPAPPNVYVQSDRGRPYYIERDRRIYMEKRRPDRHNEMNKHHEDNRHSNSYDKNERHGR
jgi:hypothetical protein